MEQLSFHVAEYEGPLDLILQLIAKHKLNICDVDISRLLEEYLETIAKWQETDMEIASEFMEMASRLVYMKSVSLLPRHEELEELKRELTGQLIEYQLCRKVAQLLRQRSGGMDLVVRQALKLPLDLTYTGTYPPGVLAEAYRDAAGRGARRLPPSAQMFEPLVTRPVTSVRSKIMTILRRLYESRRVGFYRLFEGSRSRSDIVATFLAILELMKGKRVRLEGEEQQLSLTWADAGKNE